MRTIEVNVNGRTCRRTVEPRRRLLDFLRCDLDLTGAKQGCETGDCGACSVLLDGQLVCSCLVLAVEADGRSLTTIEGLANGGELHPVQQAFVAEGGFQCGFCTPGMILAACALLAEQPDPSEAEIRHYLHGNICRCTGYTKIIRSVQTAARLAGGEAP